MMSDCVCDMLSFTCESNVKLNVKAVTTSAIEEIRVINIYLFKLQQAVHNRHNTSFSLQHSLYIIRLVKACN